MWVEKGEMKEHWGLSPFHWFLGYYFTLRVTVKLKEEEKERPAGWQETSLILKNSSEELAPILPAEEDSPALLACTIPFLLRNQVLGSSLLHCPEIGVWEGLGSAEGKAGRLRSADTERKENTEVSLGQILPAVDTESLHAFESLHVCCLFQEGGIQKVHIRVYTHIYSVSPGKQNLVPNHSLPKGVRKHFQARGKVLVKVNKHRAVQLCPGALSHKNSKEVSSIVWGRNSWDDSTSDVSWCKQTNFISWLCLQLLITLFRCGMRIVQKQNIIPICSYLLRSFCWHRERTQEVWSKGRAAQDFR